MNIMFYSVCRGGEVLGGGVGGLQAVDQASLTQMRRRKQDCRGEEQSKQETASAEALRTCVPGMPQGWRGGR